jgi:four helix bundle protein
VSRITNNQIPIIKKSKMTNEMNKIKKSEFDLEDRTFIFARSVRDFLKLVPKNPINNEYVKQLVRSSGSVGANYIEANDSLGKKDFVMRLKISRKEAKESKYWLELVESNHNDVHAVLIKEARELILIFSSIIRKLEN